MFRNLTILISISLGAALFASEVHAQFGGYGGNGYRGNGFGGGGGSNYYSNQNTFNDLRLGYCLKNDCSRGGMNGGMNGRMNGGMNGNCNCNRNASQAAPRSRFVVERGGRRVLTYVGTYEGFVQRYPQYASKIARPVVSNVRGSFGSSVGRSMPSPRAIAPGYDKYGNPLAREIPELAPPQSVVPRNGNGSRAPDSEPADSKPADKAPTKAPALESPSDKADG